MYMDPPPGAGKTRRALETNETDAILSETQQGGNMKATVRVIAKEAGVSPATVSRVLSGSAPVSPRIRTQVLKAAQNAGYLPEGLRTVAILLQENDIHSYA